MSMGRSVLPERGQLLSGSTTEENATLSPDVTNY